MKIAIYGDSFGVVNTKWDLDYIATAPLRGEALINDGPAWVEILEEEGHEITNFAFMGTAFMFSYEIFLKEHKNFDLNIFVVTSHHRTYIKELDGLRMFGYTFADEEYNRVKKLHPYSKQQIHLDILKSAKVYLELWADWEMIRHVQHVLVKNLWNLAPNTLVIPGFNDSIEGSTIGLDDLAVRELSLVVKKEVDKHDIYRNTRCMRKCHFSKENNNMLGKKIKEAIQQEKKILQLSLDDVITPGNPNLDFYLKKNSFFDRI